MRPTQPLSIRIRSARSAKLDSKLYYWMWHCENVQSDDNLVFGFACSRWGELCFMLPLWPSIEFYTPDFRSTQRRSLATVWRATGTTIQPMTLDSRRTHRTWCQQLHGRAIANHGAVSIQVTSEPTKERSITYMFNHCCRATRLFVPTNGKLVSILLICFNKLLALQLMNLFFVCFPFNSECRRKLHRLDLERETFV